MTNSQPYTPTRLGNLFLNHLTLTLLASNEYCTKYLFDGSIDRFKARLAPLAWFQRFNSFLLHLGFIGSKADPSLSIYHHNTATLYLLVYVDDIILTGSNHFAIQTILAKIRAEFAIKDLGRLSYFLGLEVHYGANDIFLSQSKYAHDILDRAKVLDAKPIAMPLASGIQLTSTGDPFPDPTLYCSLVGALQYLTITRPDLSYVVNSVSQFLQAPTTDHFQAAE
ncbi:uncharacterized mitochondrial protein AtMg00810-like [Glycine max]|uniref:uncharacterized mitochondrial protein AtMg00810-like n=1 Tax=Glycine max TaxID=3847 RepID=UPI0003DE8B4C|nr:uncharacterized mitochondrial protein AtMg00810-like [Glycine max]|eukprot:XP_006596677.1 uncharacterized protein LOC102662075 [Glycine max]